MESSCSYCGCSTIHYAANWANPQENKTVILFLFHNLNLMGETLMQYYSK